MQERQSCIVYKKASKIREMQFRVETELRRGKSNQREGESCGKLGDSCTHVTVCPSVRIDISVCLVLPYRLPETLLVSSLAPCCHWLKRREGACMCVSESDRERNSSSCLKSSSTLSEHIESPR